MTRGFAPYPTGLGPSVAVTGSGIGAGRKLSAPGERVATPE